MCQDSFTTQFAACGSNTKCEEILVSLHLPSTLVGLNFFFAYFFPTDNQWKDTRCKYKLLSVINGKLLDVEINGMVLEDNMD